MSDSFRMTCIRINKWELEDALRTDSMYMTSDITFTPHLIYDHIKEVTMTSRKTLDDSLYITTRMPFSIKT